jgi:hypothetical protein
VRTSLGSVLAACVLGACFPPVEESDGGESGEDAGAQDAGRSDAGRDAGTRSDASAGGSDAGTDGGKPDAGGGQDAEVDSGPLDPIVPGDDPPTLDADDVGYFSDADWGARILIRGRDPNGDIASYTLKFFNGTSPVSYDLDNDVDTPPVNEFTNVIVPVPNEAGFFVAFEPTSEFAAAVDTIQVLVTDEGGRTSGEQTAVRRVTPVVSSVCDPQGFNRCSSNKICARQSVNNVCTLTTSARTNACASAAILNPPGVTSVRGHVAQPSLWDAPASCSSGDPTFKPDSVVKLRLSSAAGRVVLSTDNEHTTFDTVLYVLQSCTSQPAACVDSSCPCADDVPASGGASGNNRSVLVLQDVPAGDHLIVVDSFPSGANTGDTFELTVEIEQ